MLPTLIATTIPSPEQSVWYLPIRAYALCILAGIAVAVWLTRRRYAARGGDPEVVYDVALVAVPAGIIGARIYHVLTSWTPYFGPGGDPWAALRIWEGGIGVWGGIVTAVIAGASYMRWRGLQVAPFVDAAAPAILIAQGIGRLGNWFNQEVFGSPTNLPWALEISDQNLALFNLPPGTTVHPTFLYEMLWNFACAALIIVIDRAMRERNTARGWQIFSLYAISYSIGRVALEQLRVDSTDYFGGIRVNLLVSIVTIIVFTGVFIWLRTTSIETRVSPAHGSETGQEEEKQVRL